MKVALIAAVLSLLVIVEKSSAQPQPQQRQRTLGPSSVLPPSARPATSTRSGLSGMPPPPPSTYGTPSQPYAQPAGPAPPRQPMGQAPMPFYGAPSAPSPYYGGAAGGAVSQAAVCVTRYGYCKTPGSPAVGAGCWCPTDMGPIAGRTQ